MSVNDVQVGGSHYKTGGMQHWDFVFILELGYFEGNSTKYVSRWRKKNGRQDLDKAAHYVDKMLELVSTGVEIRGQRTVLVNGAEEDQLLVEEVVKAFALSVEATEAEAEFFYLMASWSKLEDLLEARRLLTRMIEAA
jgi:hypothetical protein